MKRQHDGLNITQQSKRPFQFGRLRLESEDSSESSEAPELSLSFPSDFLPPLGYFSEDSDAPLCPITVTKFVDICAAKPNLTIYGHNFTIPCHDFPLCSKSESLAVLIQQPGNEKDQTFRFDDKVSVDVATEFLTRCYNVESEWTITDPYDYIQLYFLIDMHFSTHDKDIFLTELAFHVKSMVEGLRIRIQQPSQQIDRETLKKLDEQGCNLFFLSYELKLELTNKTWMLFLTHFRNANARAKLTIEHLDFLSTKRRVQDYHINQRFFKFLLNLCINDKYQWDEHFKKYQWAEVSIQEMKSVSRWLERQNQRHRNMVLDIYGVVLHSLMNAQQI